MLRSLVAALPSSAAGLGADPVSVELAVIATFEARAERDADRHALN
jgi:hypothetical protein